MTNIIELAREAGMEGMLTDIVCSRAELERFTVLHRAAIIAELCAGVEMPEAVAEVHLNKTGGNAGLSTHIVQIADDYYPAKTKLVTLDQMREYAAACVVREREECAKVCEMLPAYGSGDAVAMKTDCADAIRARGSV